MSRKYMVEKQYWSQYVHYYAVEANSLGEAVAHVRRLDKEVEFLGSTETGITRNGPITARRYDAEEIAQTRSDMDNQA